MVASINYRFCFLSNTKCASTSITSVLAEYGDLYTSQNPKIKHLNYLKFDKWVRPLLGAEQEKFTTIAVIREPLDWLHSWYRYRQRSSIQHPKHPHFKNSTVEVSFEEFILEYMLPKPRPFARVGQQYNFVRNKNGKIGIDKLFRYDDLSSFQSFISDLLKKEIKIPLVNVSPSTKFNLSSSTTGQLKKYLTRDYKLYNSIQ